MKGIILIVRVGLGEKQKFLLSKRLRCSSILDPMFLKLQQSKEGCDHGNDNTQPADRNLDRERVACDAGEEWNYGSGNDLGKTEALEPKLIRAALLVIPAYLIA